MRSGNAEEGDAWRRRSSKCPAANIVNSYMTERRHAMTYGQVANGRWSEAKIERCRVLRRQGRSLAEIAFAVHGTDAGVHKWVKDIPSTHPRVRQRGKRSKTAATCPRCGEKWFPPEGSTKAGRWRLCNPCGVAHSRSRDGDRLTSWTSWTSEVLAALDDPNVTSLPTRTARAVSARHSRLIRQGEIAWALAPPYSPE